MVEVMVWCMQVIGNARMSCGSAMRAVQLMQAKHDVSRLSLVSFRRVRDVSAQPLTF